MINGKQLSLVHRSYFIVPTSSFLSAPLCVAALIVLERPIRQLRQLLLLTRKLSLVFFPLSCKLLRPNPHGALLRMRFPIRTC